MLRSVAPTAGGTKHKLAGSLMKRRRRTEITVETNLLVIRRGTHRAPICCPACPSPVPLVTPEEAAVLAGTSTRTIYRWVESEQLHYVETPEGPLGKLLVCPNSLSRLT